MDEVGKLVNDFFKKGEDENVAPLLAGEAKLLQYDGEKYAVYKYLDGEVTVLSPIYPHMGCPVHFSNTEKKTWDCMIVPVREVALILLAK